MSAPSFNNIHVQWVGKIQVVKDGAVDVYTRKAKFVDSTGVETTYSLKYYPRNNAATKEKAEAVLQKQIKKLVYLADGLGLGSEGAPDALILEGKNFDVVKGRYIGKNGSREVNMMEELIRQKTTYETTVKNFKAQNKKADLVKAQEKLTKVTKQISVIESIKGIAQRALGIVPSSKAKVEENENNSAIEIRKTTPIQMMRDFYDGIGADLNQLHRDGKISDEQRTKVSIALEAFFDEFQRTGSFQVPEANKLKEVFHRILGPNGQGFMVILQSLTDQLGDPSVVSHYQNMAATKLEQGWDAFTNEIRSVVPADDVEDRLQHIRAMMDRGESIYQELNDFETELLAQNFSVRAIFRSLRDVLPIGSEYRTLEIIEPKDMPPLEKL